MPRHFVWLLALARQRQLSTMTLLTCFLGVSSRRESESRACRCEAELLCGRSDGGELASRCVALPSCSLSHLSLSTLRAPLALAPLRIRVSLPLSASAACCIRRSSIGELAQKPRVPAWSKRRRATHDCSSRHLLSRKAREVMLPPSTLSSRASARSAHAQQPCRLLCCAVRDALCSLLLLRTRRGGMGGSTLGMGASLLHLVADLWVASVSGDGWRRAAMMSGLQACALVNAAWRWAGSGGLTGLPTRHGTRGRDAARHARRHAPTTMCKLLVKKDFGRRDRS